MNPEDIIQEKDLDGYSKSMTIEAIKIVYDQMENSICLIKNNGRRGTGFFCVFQNDDEWNPITFRVMMTNNHILGENDINPGKIIKYYINKESKEIEIKDRKTYTNPDYDVTIIEMKQNDGIKPDSFLKIDKRIFILDLNKFQKYPIYLLHYPKGTQPNKSDGLILNVDGEEGNYIITHTCDSSSGSSGSPIINFNNYKVIGIHRGAHNGKNFNLGTFLKKPIEIYIGKAEIFPEKNIAKDSNEKTEVVKDELNSFSQISDEIKPLSNIQEEEKDQDFIKTSDSTNKIFPLEETEGEVYVNNELQDEYPLGLDLGTYFSCIGVYRNGGVEIIPNRNGEKTTPSIVTIIDERNILIGEETLDHLVKDYDSSIYAIKRFIGRKYADEDVKKEINKENFPFEIVGDDQGKNPLVLVDKNNKKITFTLEEISSFVIKKMVNNAEAYLGKKVHSLVITVPANFNDAQRKSTEQAAKLAGVTVLRIINEPTAAALAYGLGQSAEENSNNEKKILVFDLGGGTFDVTILKIVKGGEQNFEIMSTKGDKFLGGEDFDNKLVDNVLDRFCQKMKESKEEIKKDKKCIKRLKISCESIKRVLSSNNETTLYISNFYKGNDIYETISKSDFEDLCADLFERLKIPIDDALVDAGLTKNEINEIVLVGGSSRIPKVKSFLKNYFDINESIKTKTADNQKTRINDTINPDETVAYGATLMAAKILIKKDNNIAAFSLMDITPLSLGINVKNRSNNPEIQKEGDEMSVIINRAVKIPYSNEKTYQTSEDYQTRVGIDIYEGEKKYTKYNHILGKVDLYDLPKKKAGEVKILVKFFIDVNGILSVTATEKETGNSISTKIKNDSISLSDEDIEKIREKRKALYEKKKTKTNKDTDYTNLKENLKEFQDSYNQTDDDEEKYDILKNYNEVLEEFIDLFDKDFDNETMVEKYYIYVKQLINSYIKMLNMKDQLSKDDQNSVINRIKEYIKIFAKQSSGYLDDLLEIMKEINKKIFYEIVTIVIEELNNCGKKCLAERKKFCKYNSLKYFEKAYSIFTKYIGTFQNMSTCSIQIKKKCKEEIALSDSYINDINSNAILLTPDSLKSDKLIIPAGTGFTNNLWGLQLSKTDEQEKYQIVLANYERMLAEIKGNTREKAICIYFILKIATGYIGDNNYKKYYQLGQQCEFIADEAGIDKKENGIKNFLLFIRK